MTSNGEVYNKSSDFKKTLDIISNIQEHKMCEYVLETYACGVSVLPFPQPSKWSTPTVVALSHPFCDCIGFEVISRDVILITMK